MRVVTLPVVMCVFTACSGQIELRGSSAGADGGSGSRGADSGSSQAVRIYRPDIQRDLEDAGCTSAACHGGGAGVPMAISSSPTSDGEWESNYGEASARAGTVAASLLIDKATGGGGHVASLTVDDPMVVRWRAWIADGALYQKTADDLADAGTPGPTADASAAGLTWNGAVKSIFTAAGCTSCHGVAGAYSLQSYDGALGYGSDGDTPNVIPGDASSLLIEYCEDPDHHGGMAEASAAQIRAWIVDAGAPE